MVERWEDGRVVEVQCTDNVDTEAESGSMLSRLSTERQQLHNGSGIIVGLYLAILAPQRGFIEVRLRCLTCVMSCLDACTA